MKEDRRDVELMRQAKRGSMLAFEWLVNRHIGAVQNFFYWRTWDRDLAEDLAQEVFIKLYTALPDYRPQGAFKSYLFSIATNLLIDHYRRQRSRPTPLSLDSRGDYAQGSEMGALIDKLVAPGDRPEAAMERDELLVALRRAIDELPQEQFVVFVLHKVEERKYEEIAAELGVPIGTVKSRMNAAYQKLRAHLVQMQIDPAESEGVSETGTPAGRPTRRRAARSNEATRRPDTGTDG